MKKYLLMNFLGLAILFSSCSNGQLSKTNLAPEDFQKKMEELSNAPVIDVRTPGEYSEGHIKYAVNIDWSGDNFDQQTEVLSKDEPLFVYCLSGGRSSAAVAHLKEIGFKEVYELNGGIMRWKSASLPLTTDASGKPKAQGMSSEEFKKLTTSDKLVLVDVFAEWCGPCKKMAPSLEEIAKEMADKVTIIRIDSDKNPLISSELGIEALPTLILYKDNKIIWHNIGFLSKEEIMEHLK